MLLAAGLHNLSAQNSEPMDRGMRPGPGRGGGGPNRQELELVDKFDADENGWLNDAERKKARAYLKENRNTGRFRGPGGRRPSFGAQEEPEQPDKKQAKITPDQVTAYPDKALYDTSILRTIFLNFSNEEWEAELEDFHNTDVEVPAEMIVDGRTISGVGVHFRGNTSYMMVPEGKKRSFNVSVDFINDDQRLYGYRTLNLNNCNHDPSFLREVLYAHISGQYLPTLKVNLARVVVNGENWGLYVNVQQYNKDFLKDFFNTKDGIRWKIPPDFSGGAALTFKGEQLDAYKKSYDVKTGSADEEDWKRLVTLCEALENTPDEKLEEVLEPLLDIDQALWFLAIDNALIDGDGYFSRGSDYLLYLDPDNRFHTIAYDNNEVMSAGHGGRPGGPGGRMRRPGGFGGMPGQFGGPGGGDFPMPPESGDFPMPPGPGNFVRPQESTTTSETAPPDTSEKTGETRRGNRTFGRRDTGGFDENRQRFDRRGRDRRNRFPGGRGPGGGGPGGRGPGGGGPGGGGGGIEQSPLSQLDSSQRPLIRRLLSIPHLRARYLAHVKTIAEEAMDWKEIAPLVTQYRKLIDGEVAKDTKKLSTTEAYLHSVSAETASGTDQGMTLKEFFEKRRRFLLNHEALQKKQSEIRSVSRTVKARKNASVISEKDTVVITAEIASDVPPAKVFLYYAPAAENTFTKILMKQARKTDGSLIFEAGIPSQKAGSKVKYYVEARAAEKLGTTAFKPSPAEYRTFFYSVMP